MDNDDREASPEPSSSHLCENSVDAIDGYLSGEGPSSGVIDSSHLFSNAFDEDEDHDNFVESHSKPSGNSSEYKLIPFDRSYNYNEACQVDQSHFCERSDIYSSPSNSKHNNDDFNPMDIDDAQPGSSSSANFSTPSSDRQNEQSSGFEPTSNENQEVQYSYQLMNFDQVSEANSLNLNASSSKQADSSLFGKNKGYGKNKSSKGKGKGKMSKNSFNSKLFSTAKTFKPRENRVESSNKHSLFAVNSPQPANSFLDIEPHRVNQSNMENDNNEIDDPVHTSSPYQRDIQHLNEDEAYVVASSSEGLNGMDQILDLKSPTTPGDSCMVSSSTGQLDSLPPTPINFQGNDASHSSPASSPLNPPVLDSTVDSTSGQNLLNSPYSVENDEIDRSNDNIEFTLDEGRNEISTSVSHLQHGVDSQDLNLLVGTTNDDAHFVGPFLSLNNLNASSLHSTLTDEKSNDEAASALIPTSSAYLPDSLEIPGSSHMSEASKRLLYERRKEDVYRPSLEANNSALGQSSAPLNSIDSLSFNDENALGACNSERDLSHAGLIELGISEMEPESSTLVASSANLDNEEFPSASSESALSPSGNNFESGSTLAQLNQHYLLGIGENSLSSEDGLSPESVSQAGPELNDQTLGLNGQLREAEESLESASDSEEGASNFQASLELGLGPQQLRGLIGSRQEPQSLVPPPHLLEEAHNTDSSVNIDHIECSVSLSNSNCAENNFNKSTEQMSTLLNSEASSTDGENSFIIMVSQPESPPNSHFGAFDSQFSERKEINITDDGTSGKVEKDVFNSIDEGSKRNQASFLNESSSKSSSYHLKMDSLPASTSSLHLDTNPGEKENIYRIPNGFIITGEQEQKKKLRVSTANKSSISQMNSKELSLGAIHNNNNNNHDNHDNNNIAGIEINSPKKAAVPINMHSLFNNKPSILKPSTSKHFSNFSTKSESSEVSQLQKGDGSMEMETNEPTTENTKRVRDTIRTKCVKKTFKGNFIRSFDKEVEQEPKDDQFTCEFGTGALPEEPFINNVEMDTVGGREEEENMDEQIASSSDTPTEELAPPSGNGYWCADCESFLLSKCSLHRIQTIMDKPVLTRAWASLPGQHLAIKRVPVPVPEGQEAQDMGSDASNVNGVFTRKAIPKRTQFGPLEGRFIGTDSQPPLQPGEGLLFKNTQNGTTGVIDISEEGSSNWMRANCLGNFIVERKLGEELLPLGFTFSFPCRQEGLTKARLTTWTKGFKCSGVEGNDVVEMLKAALARRGDVRIKVCAILNDTTGTLMSCAWKNHDCRIGLIAGTGSNACYMEKLRRVELWDEESEEPHQVIINTEWGAFGDNGCLADIRTDYDDKIDKESLNPGKQLYEKMISGMYMGEIVRQVLVDLVAKGLLFDGVGSEVLADKGSFYTKYISEIESEQLGELTKCRDILEELGLNHASDSDCANVRVVCECVSRRAAYLAGAGVSVLLNRIAEERVTVAVDGSVYRYHPHFHTLMVQAISKLIKPGLKFDLMLSEDGSGRGAALVAAVASRKAMEAAR